MVEEKNIVDKVAEHSEMTIGDSISTQKSDADRKIRVAIAGLGNCATALVMGIEYYKDFKQEFPKWKYSFGQGETRIGKNREDGKITKESHEILIIKE